MKGNLQQWSDRFESETINIFREKENRIYMWTLHLLHLVSAARRSQQLRKSQFIKTFFYK